MFHTQKMLSIRPEEWKELARVFSTFPLNKTRSIVEFQMMKLFVVHGEETT